MTGVAAPWSAIGSTASSMRDSASWSAGGSLARTWRQRTRPPTSHTAAISSREVLPINTGSASDIQPLWVASAFVRVVELSRRPLGWDSYDARPLQASALRDFLETMISLSHAIQSEPAISLTTEGGLMASWSNASGSLDIIVDPSEDPRIIYEDGLDGSEWYGPVGASPRIEKWLWRTSALH
jgi:hypothetical protein